MTCIITQMPKLRSQRCSGSIRRRSGGGRTGFLPRNTRNTRKRF